MKAILKNYRQAPRKVGLITELISGKTVAQAEVVLTHLIKRGALPLLKLLKSAVANAQTNHKISDLSNYLVKAYTNKGRVLKRSMPRAMGRAFPIHKHTSQVIISLQEKEVKGLKNKN